MATHHDPKPMMKWTRRDVLKGGGLALAGFGLGQGAIAQTIARWFPQLGQALAASTGRKRAVLVGIDQYPSGTLDWPKGYGASPLQGCGTDVALMREVLIGRFGFQGDDILTLVDGEASRSAIQGAISQFLGPLTAKDTAFFHFSGCGTQWVWPGATGMGDSRQRARALVPFDGLLPESPTDLLRDLPLSEVIRGLAAGGSRRTIATIDASYSGGGGVLCPGVGRGRSRIASCQGQLGVMNKSQRLGAPISLNQWPQGLVIDAGFQGGDAVELPWGKVWAGALTYQLVQTLWNLMPARSLWIDLAPTLGQVSHQVGDRELPSALGRVPFNTVKLETVNRGTTGAFPLSPTPLVPGATGVVIEDGDSTPRVQLAGLDPWVLANAGVGSVYEALPLVPAAGASQPNLSRAKISQGNDDVAGASEHPMPTLWQLRDRQGVGGQLTALGAGRKGNPRLVKGQLVQERGRLLPANLSVVVAMDNSLARIERVDAISALTGIPQVDIAGDAQTPVDIAFGRHREGPFPPPNASNAAAPSGNRYGLFSVGGTVIPTTLVSSEEAVKVAVQRLVPFLRERLAEKWLNLTHNAAQTAIAFQVQLSSRDTNGAANSAANREATAMPPLLATTPAFGAPNISVKSLAPGAPGQRLPNREQPPQQGPYQLTVPTLPAGSALEYGLTNGGDRPLYPLIFMFDGSGGAFGYVPSQDWTVEPNTSQILFRDPPWSLPNRQTLMTSYVLVAQQPWKQVREQWNLIRRQGRLSGMVPLENPVALVRAAIADLDETCSLSLPKGDTGSDRMLLDLRKWATLQLSYRIV